MITTKKIIFASFLLVLVIGNACGDQLTPPMGWNSWDSFGLDINEAQYKSNLAFMSSSLKSHGYLFATVDEGWYTYDADNSVNDDGNSRLFPDPHRWPSTKGVGFKPIADYVHSLGLKFGIHVMRGIHKQVVNKNQPIYGTNYHAADIAVPNDKCAWNGDWYGVNMNHPAAIPYYESLLQLYADWGVDFVKIDCIFGGRDGHEKDIIAYSNAIKKTGRQIVLSLSPGLGATPQMAQSLGQYVNTYRITDDLWDCWDSSSKNVPCPYDHVTVIGAYTTFPQFENYIGAAGLNGKSFPDGDMLPLGYLQPPTGGPKKMTSLTPNEQQSLFTLWCMFRSPLIFGGDMTHMDNFTLSLLTNDEVLQIHSSSSQNKQIATSGGNTFVWRAVGNSTSYYAAVFSTASSASTYTLNLQDVVGKQVSACNVRDIWLKKNMGKIAKSVPTTIGIHGTVLYEFTECN